MTHTESDDKTSQRKWGVISASLFRSMALMGSSIQMSYDDGVYKGKMKEHLNLIESLLNHGDMSEENAVKRLNKYNNTVKNIEEDEEFNKIQIEIIKKNIGKYIPNIQKIGEDIMTQIENDNNISEENNNSNIRLYYNALYDMALVIEKSHWEGIRQGEIEERLSLIKTLLDNKEINVQTAVKRLNEYGHDTEDIAEVTGLDKTQIEKIKNQE